MCDDKRGNRLQCRKTQALQSYHVKTGVTLYSDLSVESDTFLGFVFTKCYIISIRVESSGMYCTNPVLEFVDRNNVLKTTVF